MILLCSGMIHRTIVLVVALQFAVGLLAKSVSELSSFEDAETTTIAEDVGDAVPGVATAYTVNLTSFSDFIGRSPYMEEHRATCVCGKPVPLRQPVPENACGNGSRRACPGEITSCKIVGGTDAFIRDYPWTVALIKKQATGFNGVYRPFCGGTLINNRYVITASHCVDGQQAHGLQVVVNEQDILDNTEAKTRRMDVTSIVMHPSYSRQTIDNDIALLRLQDPIDISNEVITRPACIAAASKFDFAGKSAKVVGWGATTEGGQTSTHLQQVEVPVLSNERCKKESVYGTQKITDNMLCAGQMEDGGKDSCQGDSGGPLTAEFGGRQSLIGIVSWGYGCARPKSPGVYTRVSKYTQWILENTRDATWCDG